ncbi:MAG TPA: (Fe-S)-binding protein [Gemmatimonadales bacterium]|nr:(Fe-S)-binding protein [Gemmatimonadales bacterium]
MGGGADRQSAPQADHPTDPLAPCVHCGFCLPACPTYTATSDEADSPRGRIVLMRALERGEIGAGDDALVQHLDACLGCRGCEPVCPSGVAYGRGLEQARERLFEARGLPPLARLVLDVFRRERVWRPLFTMGRWVRTLGVARLLAGRSRLGFNMAMLAATAPGRRADDASRRRTLPHPGQGPAVAPLPRDEVPRRVGAIRPTVALFRGCIMDTLFRHVHDATRRTLEANGYLVVEAPGQTCCGALHEHAGDRGHAEELARRNVAALAESADYVVVNSAGCGALLKDYGHLLGTEDAARVGAKVRDVSELLAAAGPRPGGALELDVAYDAPCHLQHAQRVHEAPLAVLRAVPGLRLRLLPDSDRCCGSAGIYAMLRPGMARLVLDAKIEVIGSANPPPRLVATGNPGCLMQIGAGLIAAGLDIPVAHPVEVLDWSYAAGGVYEAEAGSG